MIEKIMKMLSWFNMVFKAKFLRDDDQLEKEEWYVNRLEICDSCPLNSKNIPKTKWTKVMWMSWIANGFKSFCSICYCEIKAKASVGISECPDNPPKWKEI